MIILQINQTYKLGSTGKIMSDLNDVIIANGHESYMVCAYSAVKDIPNLYVMEHLNHELAVRKNLFISRVTGTMGYRQSFTTKKMIEWIKEKKPDVVHLHNIHGDWLNIHVLFEYLKESNVKVVWTLHDCWSFTGRCSHFEQANCSKWVDGCFKCTNNKIYPISYFFDWTKQMWKDKKELFTGLKNLIIVTPSQWLANYVKKSYLSDYAVKVIHNGIDMNIFCPQETQSEYLNNCVGKKIILGCASSWTERKGLLDFYKLNEMIDHKKYQIVLVGLNSRQLSEIPSDIIAIGRTNNAKELAELYSCADVFVNPTYQDNFPTTNLEAVSCGTLAVTYNTGGSPESIISSEYVVDQGDIESLWRVIKQVCEDKPYSSLELQNYGKEHFDKKDAFLGYIELYEKIEREK